MLIGDKIRLLRKNKNITQTQLAEALSVPSQSVSKWENHLSAPDITLLPVIARYFGITMDELFGYRLDARNYMDLQTYSHSISSFAYLTGKIIILSNNIHNGRYSYLFQIYFQQIFYQFRIQR